jgi:hypothetical protein
MSSKLGVDRRTRCLKKYFCEIQRSENLMVYRRMSQNILREAVSPMMIIMMMVMVMMMISHSHTTGQWFAKMHHK